MVDTKKEQKLDTALSEAYNYIKNVLICQKHVLSAADMWSGYSSIGFKPMLTREIFENFYYQMIMDSINKQYYQMIMESDDNGIR